MLCFVHLLMATLSLFLKFHNAACIRLNASEVERFKSSAKPLGNIRMQCWCLHKVLRCQFDEYQGMNCLCVFCFLGPLFFMWIWFYHWSWILSRHFLNVLQWLTTFYTINFLFFFQKEDPYDESQLSVTPLSLVFRPIIYWFHILTSSRIFLILGVS